MKHVPDRQRLLFICQLNPWRLNNGGIIRNYWMIHALASRFDIDLVTADDLDEAIPTDFRAHCSQILCFPRPAGVRARVARAWGALRPGSSYFTSLSVTGPMRSSVARLLLTRNYRAVVTELGLVSAVPYASSVPIVYASHNCESALLLRRAAIEPAWSRIAINIDGLRVRRIEARLIDRAAFVTACSQLDINDMAMFAPGITSKAAVIANGVDCAAYATVKDSPGQPGVVLITGSYDWLPNRRGLEWFLHKVLPLMKQLSPNLSFRVRVAGRMTGEFAKKLNALPDVTAVPNVPRMDAELRDASVVVVPVIASSGTRLRILEAWAAGRPVVTTPYGSFGLEYQDGVDLFSCESPRAFAEAAVKLLGDAALRTRLREAGWNRAAAYDWSAIGAKVLETFERFKLLPGNTLPGHTREEVTLNAKL